MAMIEATLQPTIQAKQFKLTDEGAVLFQPDPSNPLPGSPVGRLRRGAALLQPALELTDASVATEIVAAWLPSHIEEVLQPLVALKDQEEIQPPARAITERLHEALGILPRAELEPSIAGLDEAGRAALRARKVRLGPVLVFLPQLNKPATVRLRALLWNIWHEKPLPAKVPGDGITSFSVAGQDIDESYFRAIGYPVYGPRAIRVDMLDRLIGAVYEKAEKGVFKARHEMAEWLGCPIPDLYAVLTAMGHMKIHDPADESVPAAQAAPASVPESLAEPPPEAIARSSSVAGATPVRSEGQMSFLFTEEKVATDPVPAAATDAAVAATSPQKKPELASFRLRRGKAYGGDRRGARPSPSSDRIQKTPAIKPAAKSDKRREDKPRKQTGRKPPREAPGDRVISVVSQKKPENSPFAILKDLKVQGKE